MGDAELFIIGSVFRFPFLCLFPLLLIWAIRPGASGQEAAETGKNQESMEALLAGIHASTNESNAFLGNGGVRRLRQRLEGLDVKKQPGQGLPLLLQLGNLEIDQGNLERGIARLTEARELVDQLTSVSDGVRAEVSASLGNAYLRLAETENCCALHTPESCIVPLQGKAIHSKRRGSEMAIKYFDEVMRLEGAAKKLKMKCLWLTNLAFMTLGEYPGKVPAGIRLPEATFRSRVGFPRFSNIAGSLGLDPFNLAGGAVMDDFDGDHDLDLLTSCWDPAESMQYYRNEGNGTFVRKTAESGLSGILGGLNLVQADYDNDGDLDVYVLRGAWLFENGRHPNSLLQNQGNGTFVDRTFDAGLGKIHYPTQTAAWADFDNDGDLDLYVGNETGRGFRAPGQLFENQGDGTFLDVAERAGVTNDFVAKGVVWGDVDGDRWPDLIVSNLEAPNRLYRNQGDGTFKDMAREAGIEKPLKSFPLWTWDFNNDGQLDVFISSYSSETADFVMSYFGHKSDFEIPGHYRGDGRGRFVNVAATQGLARPMLPMGSNIGDLNNDGFLDFYLGTGEPNITVILPNMMFLNLEGGQFIDVTMSGGFGHLQKGHAVVFADYDNDGDEDIF
ncbi:MAG: VCBS repeat-containing protein, partial [Verrucomicrobiota bacterium]